MSNWDLTTPLEDFESQKTVPVAYSFFLSINYKRNRIALYGERYSLGSFVAFLHGFFPGGEKKYSSCLFLFLSLSSASLQS